MPISLKREQVIVRDLLFVLIAMGATTTLAFAGTIISPLIGSPVTATAVILIPQEMKTARSLTIFPIFWLPSKPLPETAIM